MSNLDGRRSQFPNSVDTLMELFTLPPSQRTNAAKYQYLISQNSLTATEQTELNDLTQELQEYIIDVEKWNLFGDILVNMQNFFINETQGYINDLQTSTVADINDYIDSKQVEIEAYADLKESEFSDMMSKFTYRGDYASSTTYDQWNVVTYNGETYLSLLSNNNNYTPNLAGSSAYWAKIARRGAQGIPGIDLSFAGAYDNAITYTPGQAVTHNEVIYQCITETTGNTPPNESYWVYFMASNATMIGSSEPEAPTLNQMWIDTASGVDLLKFWDGTAWRVLNSKNAETLAGRNSSDYALNEVVTTSSDGLMSFVDKQKLDGVANNANNYSHPITSGNKHIPTGGASGQFLKWSANGTATWASDNNTITTINGKTGAITKTDIVALGIPAQNTTYGLATTSVNGLMSSTDKSKLNGIATGAQVNTVTSVAGKTGAVTLTKANVGLSSVDNLSASAIRSGTTKANVGLSSVDNVKQMPIAGGTFTGVAKAQSNTSYTTRQLRNVILSTSNPSGGSNGDIWIKYE